MKKIEIELTTDVIWSAGRVRSALENINRDLIILNYYGTETNIEKMFTNGNVLIKELKHIKAILNNIKEI